MQKLSFPGVEHRAQRHSAQEWLPGQGPLSVQFPRLCSCHHTILLPGCSVCIRGNTRGHSGAPLAHLEQVRLCDILAEITDGRAVAGEFSPVVSVRWL